ncbi:rubredoxin [Acaryochloris sp. CCMEE 5410]|uniref:rubredoxin n=1 Tax=Acaryochloris sp. CCMEE 5410 TaxID=310037 RepID=UPI00024843B6|nr:rubredoxin [Acaryochloris sp. CCMEE 5410]KAI9134369.1 rubredoxin [Acaryochloris sp. CCMEE 5410]
MSTETDSNEEVVPVDRFECRSCGYIYEPDEGDKRRKIPPGTLFDQLPNDWKCPVCRTPMEQFVNIGPVGAPSGFPENLGYGFGVNAMTPGKKNLLIFGTLLLIFLFLLSFYSSG